jgi:hypothetical protein
MDFEKILPTTEAVYNAYKVWKCDFETHLLRSKLLKTNGRKLAKYWLDLVEEEEEEEGGEECREVTWNEGGTEQTDNCTFHQEKGKKISNLRQNVSVHTITITAHW